MKKNYNKCLLSICAILLLIIVPKNVYAIPAKAASEHKKQNTGVYYSPRGVQSAEKEYTYSPLTITFNGKTYRAYCLDPGDHLSSNMTYECQPYNGSGGVPYIFEQNLDPAAKSLALRMYGIMVEQNNGSMNDIKSAVINYFLARESDGWVHPQFPQYGKFWNYMYDVNAGSQTDSSSWDKGILGSAYRAAWSAYYEHSGDRSFSDGNSGNSGVTIRKTSVNDKQVTYNVSSTYQIDPAYMKFSCSGANCKILNSNWNGMSGSVTLEVDCDATFSLYAENCTPGANPNNPGEGDEGNNPGGRYYTCNVNSPNAQTLLVDITEIITNGSGNGTGDGTSGNGSITGGTCALVSKLENEKIECTTCCTDDPIEPGHIEGTIYNCCTDNKVSEAHQYSLDQLFCDDPTLEISKYREKCNANSFVDETSKSTLDEEYCQMFCTERVSTEIPDAMTATSGRYFSLNETSKGTTSPYIEGARRCRIRIDYPKWEKAYKEQVDKQVTAYNDFQDNITWYNIYNSAKESTVSGSINLKVTCSTTETYSCGTPEDPNKKCSKTTCSKENSGTYSYSYKKYTFGITSQDYYTIGLNNQKYTQHAAFEINNPTKKTHTHGQYSTYDLNDQISKANAARDALSCGCEDKSYSRDSLPDEGKDYPNEDVPKKKTDYYTAATVTNQGQYDAAANKAKNLENTLDKCVNYFTKYEGANAEASYRFNANIAFNYTQVYLDDEGKMQMDYQNIPFKPTPGCKVSGPLAGPDSVDGLSGKTYSGVYSASGNSIQLGDFAQKTLAYESGSTGYTKYTKKGVSADKVFRHDAKYLVECKWEEDENKYYTLLPSGSASETKETANFVRHERHYRVYLTTMTGSYQTNWKLSGLGTNGLFDDYFKKNGTNTCSGNQPNDDSVLSCKLKVEWEVVLTGKCNDPDSPPIDDPKNCPDPRVEQMSLMTFRVVDPANVFPSGTTKDGEKIAYNWTDEPKGQAAQKEIETTASTDSTYAPSNLTYSFTLTPKDMKEIQKYNESKNGKGGYSDFELTCSCIGKTNSEGECMGNDPKDKDYSGYMSKCKSTFITNLADGNVVYDNTNHKVSGWSGTKTLNQVRDSILR